MNTDSTPIYHSLNLPIEKLREYNLEKYHFLSGILDILFLHLHVEKEFTLSMDDIYEHFKMQHLNFKKEKEKYNAAIVQLLSSGMIERDSNGIISVTEKGLNAYQNLLYHNIASNLYSADRSSHLAEAALYAADRSNHLAKVAILAASILSIISIACTIISICCNS